MSSSLQEARLKRIHVDREDVAKLEARLASLERAHVEANAAYRAARIAVDELELEIQGVSTQLQATTERVKSVLQVYRRDFMATIPFDCLRCVFEELVAHQQFGTGDRSHDLVIMPFRVAAVCRRWREAAFETTRLWSFIHVTQLNAIQLARSKLVIQRSQQAALDIYIKCLFAAPELKHDFLEALAVALFRVREVEWWTTTFGFSPDDWALFKHPTPALQKLFMVYAPGNSQGDAQHISRMRGYLPFAPHVQSISILSDSTISTIAPFPIRPRTPYPSLVSFTWFQADLSLAWGILGCAAATLEVVLLDSRTGTPDPSLTLPPLTLPNVRKLGFTNLAVTGQLSDSLRAPRLQHLCLAGSSILPYIQQFLVTVSPSVTSLTLFQGLRPDHLTLLRSLGNIVRLECGKFVPHLRCDYIISDSFFEGAARPGAEGSHIWPKLSSLVLQDQGRFTAEDGEGLVDFVRSRTAPGLDDCSTPRRLERVTLDAEGVPGWVRAEVKRLVNDKS